MTAAKPKTQPKKPKLIRDSFSIPKTEYAAIDALKSRAVSLGTTVKKSELLRAGLMALQAMSDAALRRTLAAVPTLKTGRPAATPHVKAVVTPPAPAPSPAPARRRAVRKAPPAATAVEGASGHSAKSAKTPAGPAARRRAAVKKTVTG